MNQDELDELIGITQVILGDRDLGSTLRKIIASHDKQRSQYIDALSSILRKRGLADAKVNALNHLKDADVIEQIRKLL